MQNTMTTVAPAIHPLLTAAQVAQILQISKPHAYRLMRDIGAVRMGKAVRVQRADLERYIERSKAQQS